MIAIFYTKFINQLLFVYSALQNPLKNAILVKVLP
jgi:hypothetical protein